MFKKYKLTHSHVLATRIFKIFLTEARNFRTWLLFTLLNVQQGEVTKKDEAIISSLKNNTTNPKT